MPPKRDTRQSASNTSEDENEMSTTMKKCLAPLEQDVSSMLNQMTEFLSRIEHLEKENRQKDKKIQELEQKCDNLEQYTRAENFIISNLDVKPSSYAASLKKGRDNENDNNTNDNDNVSLETQVVKYLNDNSIPIKHEEISVCHPIGNKKPHKDIVVRCVSRKTKAMVMLKVRKEKVLNSNGKSTDVHINEHLTRKNQHLSYIGRCLKKKEANF